MKTMTMTLLLMLTLLFFAPLGLADDQAKSPVLIGVTSSGDVMLNYQKNIEAGLVNALAGAPSVHVICSRTADVAALKSVLDACAATGVKSIDLESVDGEPLQAMIECRLDFGQASCMVGDTLTAKVTLTNHSSAPATIIKPMLGRESISLHVKTEAMAAPAVWTRYYGHYDYSPSPTNPREPISTWVQDDLETITLDAGATAEWGIAVPALSTGVWEWSASYAGLGANAMISSAPQSAQVSPRGDAEKAVVEITTNAGTVYVELLVEETPGTALNFASSVANEKYDGLIFHRVIKDFMIQGGDPDGTGEGSFGYIIPFETPVSKHLPGVLSMAREPALDSAGSQFFLMHGTSPHLDGKYCAFGRTLQGQDVINTIAECAVGGPQNSTPKEKQYIETARIVAWPLQAK